MTFSFDQNLMTFSFDQHGYDANLKVLALALLRVSGCGLKRRLLICITGKCPSYAERASEVESLPALRILQVLRPVR